MSARAKELFETSVDQVRRGEVRAALGTLLDALAAEPAHAPSLAAAGRICRVLGAPDDAALFEQLAEHPQDPGALFALGHRLVEQTREDVAVGLLRRGLDVLEDDPRANTVRRELAFAQYMTRDFLGCLTTLSPLQALPDLADPELLDVRLLAAESALYASRRELCQHLLEQCDDLVPEDDQRVRLDALHGLLGRSRRWPRLAGLGLREWHFIQHAGVLLKTAGGWFEDGSRAGRFEFLDLRLDMVAFLLRRLIDLLEQRRLVPEVVVPASETAAPLAAALAATLGRPLAADLVERRGRSALLVAANAGELSPLVAGLVRHRPELLVFALNLDWGLDAPVCPEVAGVLARRTLLPWETRYALDPTTRRMRTVPADERPAVAIGADLAAAMAALPDDGGTARDEFLGFYAPLADELVLGNWDAHPHRRQFTRLSPCWAPTGPVAAAARD